MSTTKRQREKIKIAIPMVDGEFSEHFGAARVFLIFHGDQATRSFAGKEVFGAPEHTPGSLPQWLKEQGVDSLVSAAIGERALVMLANAGIEVFLADGGSDPSELALSCLSGKLQRANRENSRCQGGHHDHGDAHACQQHQVNARTEGFAP
jgi:predicted Fe-Mo cluster-binding NifX family protein